MAPVQTQQTAPVKMDSRKLLGAINDSVQSRAAFVDSKVKEMGARAGKNWRSASLLIKNTNRDGLFSGELYIEDADTHNYLLADCSRQKGGRIVIENIRPIEVVEEQKQALFESTCLQLINAIEGNDQKGMEVAFDRMAAQRFAPRAIPLSGIVKTRDGVLRHINVSNGDTLADDVRTRLVAAIVESLRDNIIVENGSVVSGIFGDGDEVKLPVTKWTTRKLCAKHMREAANDAFRSPGFQERIYQAARLVYEDDIKGAVSLLTPLLSENEEFTLLSRGQIQTLVENALATKAIFNQDLCNDTATLFHRTNLKVNRRTVLDEWKKIAIAVEHPTLLENVHILEESKNFEAAYDKFLHLVFEAISNRQVTAEALATTLDVLRNKTPKIRESHELSGRLAELITRLREPDFDDSAIYEAEDLIATIQEELAANDSLGNFDSIPGDTSKSISSTASPNPLGNLGGGGGQIPPIVINAPLISIGSSNAGGGQSPEPGGGDAADLLGGGEEEQGQEQGGQQPPPGGGSDLDQLLGGPARGGGGMGVESRTASGRVLKEWEKPWLKKDKNKDGDGDGDGDDKDGDGDEGGESKKPWETVAEHSDPYAFTADSKTFNPSDYGAPVIGDRRTLAEIANVMRQLAMEHSLQGSRLQANLQTLAEAGIEGVGLKLPKGKINAAVNEAVRYFIECDEPMPPGHEEEEDEGVAEDQLHGPRIPARGYGRASFEPRSLQQSKSHGGGSVSESRQHGINWIAEEPHALLGELAGIRFVLEHGQTAGLAPVLMDENGEVEVPIPEDIQESALAAAHLVDGNPQPFIAWLAEGIEQFRPLDDDESAALNEAVASIQANADGSIVVSVDSDVEVQQNGEEGGDADDTGGMEPVDSIDAGEGGAAGGEAEGGMPDFEGGGEVPGETPEAAGGDMGGEGGDMGSEMGGEMGGGEGGDMGGEFGGEAGGEAPPAAGGAPAEPPGNPPKRPAMNDGIAEDDDITEPRSGKYTDQAMGNKRQVPAVRLPKKSDDQVRGLGPKPLHKDNGKGTSSTTAKKSSD